MDPFFLRLALSFAVGGLWISLTTVAAERLGPRAGGFLGGLPSTAVVALCFISWTQGAPAAAQAAWFLPLAFTGNAAFLLLFAALARRGPAPALAAGFVGWAVPQAALVLRPAAGEAFAIAAWLAALAISLALLETVLRPRPLPGFVLRYGWVRLAARAAFGGATVALAVLAARLGGAAWGGAFSSFPAVMTASLFITARSAGREFSRSLAAPLLVSVMVNCPAFALVFGLLVEGHGAAAAALAGYAAALAAAGPAWLSLRQWA